jgi:tetratricopeptide (TPR) repeat protein
VLLLALAGFETIDSPYEAAPLANDAYGSGRYREAADLYEVALAELPESPELHFNLGNAHFKLHDLEKATEAYLRALDTDDRLLAATARYNLGNVHYQRALNAMRTFRDAVTPIREAMLSYRDSLALDPELADAMYNLELADRLYDELSAMRMERQANPVIRDQAISENRGQLLDEPAENQRSRDRDSEDDPTSQPQGEQGVPTPQGSASWDDAAQVQPEGSQREMTAEEAQEMVELVRDKARAAESMRRQWRQARMRESGIEKPW